MCQTFSGGKRLTQNLNRRGPPQKAIDIRLRSVHTHIGLVFAAGSASAASIVEAQRKVKIHRVVRTPLRSIETMVVLLVKKLRMTVTPNTAKPQHLQASRSMIWRRARPHSESVGSTVNDKVCSMTSEDSPIFNHASFK